MELVRGLLPVLDALGAGTTLVAPPDLDVPPDAWVDLYLSYLVQPHGLSGNHLCPDVMRPTPVLAISDNRALPLLEFNTQDKGPLPVWAFEMGLYPTHIGTLLDSCPWLFEGGLLRYVPEGRPDYVIDLTSDWRRRLGSRVLRNIRKSVGSGLTTTRVDVHKFVYASTEACGQQIALEDMLHHANTYHLRPADHEFALHQFVPCNLDLRHVLKVKGYSCYATYAGPTLVALSLCYDSGQERYWIRTQLARTGVAAELRVRFNLLYTILEGLINDACADGQHVFNLGITSFDYKRDFTDQVKWYPGIEYA